jgi:hypothetical protein
MTDREFRHPTVPVHQLRVGDVARTPNGQEWEVRDRPRQKHDGQHIEASVQRPGNPQIVTTISWPSADLVPVRRPTRPPAVDTPRTARRGPDLSVEIVAGSVPAVPRRPVIGQWSPSPRP